MSGNVLGVELLDLILLAIAVVFGFMGYRQGFVVGALSFVGFLGGAVIGLQLAPLAANRFAAPSTRLFVALLVAFGIAVAGQSLALAMGSRIREQLRDPRLQAVDGIGGSAVSALTVLIVAWMLAAPLASAPEPWLAAQIRSSAVLAIVDDAMPGSVRNAYRSFSDSVRQQDFPEIFDGLTPSDVPPVASPDPALARSQVAQRARRSVVKIVGDAPRCDRQLSGTGFVYAPQRIMTNAHVVAGTNEVRIELLGKRYSARVVVYDPRRDLAVLYAPTLDAPVMTFTGAAGRGDDAIVAGFPLSNPYTVV
ncbi:MAG: MarP family serine protease, partial [Mycobacteriales bacterium]